jgi:protein-tyrosine-phosphatase
MAEHLARALSPDDDVEFSSAGVGTHGRMTPSSGSTEVMAELGLDISGHRSRQVWEVGPDADVIFAMSAEHRDAVVDRWPDRADSIHMLRPDNGSIEDPYGMAIEEYRATREEIEAAIRERIATGWAKTTSAS